MTKKNKYYHSYFLYLWKNYHSKGGYPMAKDSQIDPKEVRMKKCNYQTPLTSEEAKNHNRTSKKHSVKSEGYGNH